MRKFLAALPLALAAPALVSAHVRVTPAQVGTAAFQTFNMSVPVEKDIPTTALRLALPVGLKYVTPTVKNGWTIATKTDVDGNVNEISWAAGSIPVGQRDDFTFAAQVPASAGEIDWKAYQTYSDGTVVAWDQEKESDDEEANVGPYSKTMVVNDLASPTPAASGETVPATDRDKATLVMSATALALSAVAAAASLRRR